MFNLYNRIEELCRSKGINITVMCQQSGAPRGALSDIKTGRKKGLSSATLEKIAEYFGVSVDYILGREAHIGDFSLELSENEKKLLELIKQLSDDEVKQVSDYIDFILSKRGK